MNDLTAAKARPEGLALLREPFPEHHISKLPKPTKKQTEDLKEATNRKDFSLGIRCKLCGQWHHKDVAHLDYVGHAALTYRLLECDDAWTWEPMSLTPTGAPAIDANGGMWIKLTVCGVTRLGYGHPDGKTGGDAVKEMIGDALRNAAMRFGAALDLWHKGDPHADEEAADPVLDNSVTDAQVMLESADSLADLQAVWKSIAPAVQKNPAVIAAKDARKAALTQQKAA